MILVNKIIEAFKGKKKIALILLLVSLGLMLIAISSIDSGGEVDSSDLSEYKEALEKRLEKLCSEVDGGGEVYCYGDLFTR